MCETATNVRELIGLSVVNEAGSTVLKVHDCFVPVTKVSVTFPGTFPVTAPYHASDLYHRMWCLQPIAQSQ